LRFILEAKICQYLTRTLDLPGTQGPERSPDVPAAG